MVSKWLTGLPDLTRFSQNTAKRTPSIFVEIVRNLNSAGNQRFSFDATSLITNVSTSETVDFPCGFILENSTLFTVCFLFYHKAY